MYQGTKRLSRHIMPAEAASSSPKKSPGKKHRVAPAPPDGSSALRKSASAAQLPTKRGNAWTDSPTPSPATRPSSSTPLTGDRFPSTSATTFAESSLSEVQTGVAAIVTDKYKLELQLSKAEDDLRKARLTIDQHALQIQTLVGRSAAVRVGSEEASARGETWSIADVKRFSSLPKGPAEFTAEVLRELLDQGLSASHKRVGDAIKLSAAARAESEAAAAEGDANLEEAYSRCQGLTAAAEHSVRQATLGVLTGGQRRAKKLRTCLRRLEEEASAAIAVHASDMRNVVSRLVAQRDAHVAMLLGDLYATELEGHNSIRGLRAELAAKETVIEARDADIGRLQGCWDDEKARLRNEKKARAVDNRQLQQQLKCLQREITSMERETAISQRERQTNRQCLARELRAEERSRDEERKRLWQQIERLEDQHREEVTEYERRLKVMRADARATLEAMNERLRSLTGEKAALEVQREYELALAHADAAKERSFLAKKVIACRLPADCLTIARRLHADCPPIASRSPADCKPIACRLPDPLSPSLGASPPDAPHPPSPPLDVQADKLGSQVKALKASTSRGRALFYWSSMKKPGAALAAANAQRGGLDFGSEHLSSTMSDRLRYELGAEDAAEADFVASAYAESDYSYGAGLVPDAESDASWRQPAGRRDGHTASLGRSPSGSSVSRPASPSELRPPDFGKARFPAGGTGGGLGNPTSPHTDSARVAAFRAASPPT